MQEGEAWGCYQELRPGRACRAGHPAESHPSGGRLPALGLSYCPGEAGQGRQLFACWFSGLPGQQPGANCGHPWECASWVSRALVLQVVAGCSFGPRTDGIHLTGCRCAITGWALELQDRSYLIWAQLGSPVSSQNSLDWRIPGTEEPSGLPSMGLHRVRHDWSDLAA